MKKMVVLMLGLVLLTMVVTPQAEARHGGTAFVLGALTGAIVASAVASSYYYPPYYYSYPQPVVVQQPVYQPYPVYQQVYISPVYTPRHNYRPSWGWYYR